MAKKDEYDGPEKRRDSNTDRTIKVSSLLKFFRPSTVLNSIRKTKSDDPKPRSTDYEDDA